MGEADAELLDGIGLGNVSNIGKRS